MKKTCIPTAHISFVHHLTLNPSETLLASCSSDKTIQIYHRETEEREQDSVNNVSLNNDSYNVNNTSPENINRVSNNDATRMWSLKCVLSEHSGPIFCLAWCPYLDLGSLLIAAGADRFIYMYRFIIVTQDCSTRVQYERLTPLHGLEKDVITGIAFVPRQDNMSLLLSTASLDGCVRVYENKRGSGLSKVRVIAVMQKTIINNAFNIRGNNSSLINENTSHKAKKALTTERVSTSSILQNARESEGSHISSEGSSSQTPLPHFNSAVTAINKATLEKKTKTPILSKTPSLAAEAAKQSDGVTSFAWFPGAAERGLTLAIGTISGYCYLHYNDDVLNTEFTRLHLPDNIEEELQCASPVEDVKWTQPVGRRFHLLAICSREVVFILRVNCISPSLDRESITYELYRHNTGAVSASWSRSATLLHLVNDDLTRKIDILRMRNPLNHQS